MGVIVTVQKVYGVEQKAPEAEPEEGLRGRPKTKDRCCEGRADVEDKQQAQEMKVKEPKDSRIGHGVMNGVKSQLSPINEAIGDLSHDNSRVMGVEGGRGRSGWKVRGS